MSVLATLVSERVGQFFVEGHRLEFTEYGAGDRWVVLIHGQLMPRRMHEPLARAIAGEGFHVVTVDLLGHGRSDRPLDPKGYSMTAFGEQVVALLDHLGADQAVIGGTSLGAERLARGRRRRAGPGPRPALEMPVLDNALEAGLIAFGPVMFLARFVPLSITITRRLAKLVPRGVVPFWTGIALDTLDQRPAPMAAAIHGIFFGRIAPSSKRRRRIEAPALVIGHPRDPIHPAADAAMLAGGDAARTVRRRPQHHRVALPSGAAQLGGHRLRVAVLEPPGRVPEPPCRADLQVPRGTMGRVGLYRDEAIVLRTQKLGEADRIITLLTRSTGRVRAVAKGVRRTTSRFGSRLEPFTHVDLQLAEGRSLDVVTQAVTLDPFAARMGADYERYTAGTVMLETAERLVVEDKEPALQQFLLLVGALRAMCDAGRPPSAVLDSFLLRSLAVAGYAPSFEGCARCGLEGQHRSFSPAAGGMLCSTCRVPGSMNPSGRHRRAAGRAAGRRLAGGRGERAPHPAGGDRDGRGLPAVAPRARPQVARPRARARAQVARAACRPRC